MSRFECWLLMESGPTAFGIGKAEAVGLASREAHRFLLNARVIALVQVEHVWAIEPLFEAAGNQDEAVVQFCSPTKQMIALRQGNDL